MNANLRSSRCLAAAGFTLVEMLVSMAIVVILMVILVRTTDAVRRTTTQTTGKIEQFREARDGFEAVTRRLSQATLNTYNDIDPQQVISNDPNSKYVRASELRFISGNAEELVSGVELSGSKHPTHGVFFIAPFGYTKPGSNYAGMANLLNTWGFFIEWGSDKNYRPGFLPASVPEKYRFRLMEYSVATEDQTIYKYTSGTNDPLPSVSNNYKPQRSKSWTYTRKDWFTDTLTTARVRPIADNIIFLSLLPMVAPKDATNPQPDGTSTDIAPDYRYDTSKDSAPLTPSSLNQLPAMVQVTMIALEDKSFARYLGGSTAMPDFRLDDILTTASERQDDIKKVTDKLNDNHLSYRIFSSAVPLVTKGPSN